MTLLKLFKIALCIIVSHVIMGIFQEKVFKTPYGESKEKFTFAIAYGGVQSFSYMLIAKGIVACSGHEKNEVSQIYFALPAIFFVAAMLCSNLALKFISYPLQVVGKSSKPIAVMLLGVLIGRKSYTFKKYIFVFIIVFGVVMFSMYNNKNDKETRDANDNDHITGMSLIAFSLLMDGMMGGLQDRMRSVKTPTSLNLMLFINAWSSLYLAFLLIFTMEGYDFIIFCMDHYEVIIDLIIVTFVGSIAQFFISEMIANFGSLPLSLVLTLRKFITVFLSVLIYKHSLTIEQWIAAIFVFGALILDAIYQHKDKIDDERQTQIIDEDVQENDEKDNEKMVKEIV